MTREETSRQFQDVRENHLHLQGDMQRQFQEVYRRMDTHFRWTMGTTITLIGMMAGVIFTAVKF